jgi:hypothetical protein
VQVGGEPLIGEVCRRPGLPGGRRGVVRDRNVERSSAELGQRGAQRSERAGALAVEDVLEVARQVLDDRQAFGDGVRCPSPAWKRSSESSISQPASSIWRVPVSGPRAWRDEQVWRSARSESPILSSSRKLPRSVSVVYRVVGGVGGGAVDQHGDLPVRDCELICRGFTSGTWRHESSKAHAQMAALQARRY